MVSSIKRERVKTKKRTPARELLLRVSTGLPFLESLQQALCFLLHPFLHDAAVVLREQHDEVVQDDIVHDGEVEDDVEDAQDLVLHDLLDDVLVQHQVGGGEIGAKEALEFFHVVEEAVAHVGEAHDGQNGQVQEGEHGRHQHKKLRQRWDVAVEENKKTLI